MAQPSRYLDVLTQLSRNERIPGSTLKALPRLRSTADLPADHLFKPRDVWPLVVDSAAHLAVGNDDTETGWYLVALHLMACRSNGHDVGREPVLRGMLTALGMVADFAGGLDRAGLLPDAHAASACVERNGRGL